jgi:hypothetical protein
MLARDVTAPITAPRGAVRPPAVSLHAALLVALFAILNAGDLMSTLLDLNAGLREGNPFMNLLLQHYGFGALIGYKCVVVALVGAITCFMFPQRPRLVAITMGVCDMLVFSAIVVNVVQFPAA